METHSMTDLPESVVHNILSIVFTEVKGNRVAERQVHWACAAVCRTWRTVSLTLLLEDGHLPISADLPPGPKPQQAGRRPAASSPPSLHHVFWHPLHMLLPQKTPITDDSRSTTGLSRCLVIRTRLPGGFNAFTLYGNAEQSYGQRCFMLHAFQTSRIRPTYTLSLSHTRPKEAAFATLRADSINRSHYTLDTLDLSKRPWLHKWLASAGLVCEDDPTLLSTCNSIASDSTTSITMLPSITAATASSSSQSTLPWTFTAKSATDRSSGVATTSTTSTASGTVVCLARMYPAQFTYGSGLPRRLDMQCLRPRRPCDGCKTVTKALLTFNTTPVSRTYSQHGIKSNTTTTTSTALTPSEVPSWPSLTIGRTSQPHNCTASHHLPTVHTNTHDLLNGGAHLQAPHQEGASSSTMGEEVPQGDSHGPGAHRRVPRSTQAPRTSSGGSVAMLGVPHRRLQRHSVTLANLPRHLATTNLPRHLTIANLTRQLTIANNPTTISLTTTPSTSHTSHHHVPSAVRWVRSLRSAFSRTFHPHAVPSTSTSTSTTNPKPPAPPSPFPIIEHITALGGTAPLTSTVIVARHTPCGTQTSYHAIPTATTTLASPPPSTCSTAISTPTPVPTTPTPGDVAPAFPDSSTAPTRTTGIATLRRAHSMPSSGADRAHIQLILPELTQAAISPSAAPQAMPAPTAAPPTTPVDTSIHDPHSSSGASSSTGASSSSSNSTSVPPPPLRSSKSEGAPLRVPGSDATDMELQRGVRDNTTSALGRPRLVRFTSKQPHWNTNMHAWCLNFGGRVRLPSARNFQLCMPEGEGCDHDSARVVLQFGKVGPDAFCLDWELSLMSPAQALASALTTFHRSWGLN